MLEGYQAFRNALDSGVVLIGHKLDQLLRQNATAADIDDETLTELWELLGEDYRYSVDDFRAAALLADTENDMAALQNLIRLIAPILESGADDKRDELIRQIKTLGDAKILIFTEYQDTAHYLLHALRAAFPQRVIECATGSRPTNKANS